MDNFDKTKEVSDFQKEDSNYKLADEIEIEKNMKIDKDNNDLFVYGHKILVQNSKYYLYNLAFFCNNWQERYRIQKEILEILKNVKYASEKITNIVEINKFIFDLNELYFSDKSDGPWEYYRKNNPSPNNDTRPVVPFPGGKSKKPKNRKKHKKKTQKRKR